MEKLTPKEKNKPKIWLSKKVQNYSKAIVFSIATILWAQSSDTIADNLLSDSTIQISKAAKSSSESEKNIENFTNVLANLMLKSKYKYIEQNNWTLKAIEQKLQDQCQLSWNKCDIKERMDFYINAEKAIIAYFIENVANGYNILSINLNVDNISKMLDILPYIENILSARYWENYMEVLTNENIINWAYDFEISINMINWKYKIINIGLFKKYEEIIKTKN